MVMVILMAPTQLFLCHIKPMKRSLNNEHILTDLPFTCSKEAVASQSACTCSLCQVVVCRLDKSRRKMFSVSVVGMQIQPFPAKESVLQSRD